MNRCSSNTYLFLCARPEGHEDAIHAINWPTVAWNDDKEYLCALTDVSSGNFCRLNKLHVGDHSLVSLNFFHALEKWIGGWLYG